MTIEQQFPHIEQLIYLNHAAVAPWPRCAQEAVAAFARENVEFGAKDYPKWMKTEQRLKRNLATLLNAPSTADIALVKNTSEALSFVAYGLDWQAGDNVVISDQEFPSNRIVWESLAQFGVELRQADLASAASPEEALMAQVDDRTRLLSISSIEYASGLKIDLETLGRFCRQQQIFFCVDAIQSLGAVALDVQAIQADFVMADGHKWMLGPEGLAVFYSRKAVRDELRLTQYGWHMVEPLGDYDNPQWRIASSGRRFECGSPNMLGIHALDASIALLLAQGMDNVEAALSANAARLIDEIQQRPTLQLLTDSSPGRFGGIVTFRAKGCDNATLQQQLMDRNVICAHRGGGVRFSAHFYTPASHLTAAMALVDELIG